MVSWKKRRHKEGSKLKLDRLLAITMLLLNRRRVSAKELSERFEVSLRTIYRDLEAINGAGIPVASYAGASGGYEIMETYRIERQYLSLEELQSIIVALRGIQTTLAEPDIDIGSLLDKVGSLVARTASGGTADLRLEMILDLNPWQGGQAEKAKLHLLKQAIRAQQLISFGYTSSQGEDSARTCEPMGVVLKGYIWYLYGFCRLRTDFRIFRLSRIMDLTLLGETFERRAGELEELRFGWNADYHAKRALLGLVLQFSPRAKAKVQDGFEESEIETRPDGSLLVRCQRPDEPWLYSMLMSYGTDVRVLEPSSVADMLRQKAQEIVRMYGR
ncbi:Helix-turn-helix type 11 domain-containing protein [Paenibacillus mucilaginosus 3016]|uniref:Helix-turn-helix type 11 domain-containing protein n=1 Tax=Paenibacillus mucilaginosus 3016 TaxID=1116391 RepID=H6NS85_9BACL|nr:YafY family protein [Paenibacillus mucilaginosus]AFC27379.1 Helix-turn-helix type 11 domain-containing protein [Paenibacillus mucilaginosus 3016]WFA16289.1 YafY family transcriptional regulator [Paenibacillus mucilaginosus]